MSAPKEITLVMRDAPSVTLIMRTPNPGSAVAKQYALDGVIVSVLKDPQQGFTEFTGENTP